MGQPHFCSQSYRRRGRGTWARWVPERGERAPGMTGPQEEETPEGSEVKAEISDGAKQ